VSSPSAVQEREIPADTKTREEDLGRTSVQERGVPADTKDEDALKPCCDISAAEFLQILEGCDSELAASAVRRVSAEVLNHRSDDDCRSALLLAAMEGHADACSALLERDDFVGVTARGSIGSTALHMAAANGHRQICQMLLRCPRYDPPGGVNAVNDNGQTAFDFAVEFGDQACANLLASAGGSRKKDRTRASVVLRGGIPGRGDVVAHATAETQMGDDDVAAVGMDKQMDELD